MRRAGDPFLARMSNQICRIWFLTRLRVVINLSLGVNSFTRALLSTCILPRFLTFLRFRKCYLLLLFLRLRTVITSCCLSPSTSANRRLISEYLSSISFNSCSIDLFLSLSTAISARKTLQLSSLWTMGFPLTCCALSTVSFLSPDFRWILLLLSACFTSCGVNHKI